jgi:phosphoserine phosphatase
VTDHPATLTATEPTAPTVGDGPFLLVMDVDSTLIDQEVIELLAEHADTRDEVAAVTERAMRGELDFAQSLHERVATLAGLPVSVLDEVVAAATYTHGARELVAECHRRGWPVGLVSGGFAEIVEPLAAELGITWTRANRLRVAGGRFTGEVEGTVVDRTVKATTLREYAARAGVPMSRTVAVGDGANDLEMIAEAGIGIAFCAKPVVRDAAPWHVDERDLRQVLMVVDEVIAGRLTARG